MSETNNIKIYIYNLKDRWLLSEVKHEYLGVEPTVGSIALSPKPSKKQDQLLCALSKGMIIEEV